MVEDVITHGWQGGRDEQGRFTNGHEPRYQAKTLANYIRDVGDELAVAVKNDQGMVVATITRLQALAQRLWSDALNSDGKASLKLVVQARGILCDRLAPVPRDGLDVHLIPADRGSLSPRAVGFLEALDKASGGHPTPHQMLEELRKLDPSHLLENGNGNQLTSPPDDT